MSLMHALDDLIIWYWCSCYTSSSFGPYLIWLSAWIGVDTVLVLLFPESVL